jgi:hypothetical protein
MMSEQEQQQEQTQQPVMQRLTSLETVESFVSPLRIDEEAGDGNSKAPHGPLMDLSIMDLKARKERLQQMIRDIEIRDEQEQVQKEQQQKVNLLQQLAQQPQQLSLDGDEATIVAGDDDHPMDVVVQITPPEESASDEVTEEKVALADEVLALSEVVTLAPIVEESSPEGEEEGEREEEENEQNVETEEAVALVVEASPAAAAPVGTADDPEEPPVSVESTTQEQQEEEQEQVLLRPKKSAFRTGDAFAKPASPRRVVFDLSAVQVYQDFRVLPQLPFQQDDFDDDVHVDEDKNDEDNNNNNNSNLYEEVAEDDDDDEEVWEEEVIEDDDVVHLAPPPPPATNTTTTTFTVTPPTWEDRERFAKKLYDLRDAEDSTSVTDDSTVSDLRSDTSFGSPVSNRFLEQQQLHAYGAQSPPSPPSPSSRRRPLSPPCSRRFSLAAPAPPLSGSQLLAASGEKQERRMSMPSFLPKQSKTSASPLSKPNICSSTGKVLPTPTVVSSPQTLPSESASYPTVSLSFLAQNLTTTVAVRVMEEALRILQPGGILYVFDVEGAAVKKLPDELRDLLVRVPYAGVKQTVHEIQTQEIMRNHGFVDLFPREDQIVRWMAVKASANYTVELA